MDWQIVAYAGWALGAALSGVLWSRVSGDLARVADRLAEVGQIVHGHQIEIEALKGQVRHGR